MLPLNPNQIKPLYQDALKLHSQGKLSAAKQRYQAILSVAQNIAEVHFQLGRIAFAEGQLGDADKHLRTARSLKPNEPAIWQLLLEVSQKTGNGKSVKTLLAEAKSAKLPPAVLIQLQDRAKPAKASSKIQLGAADPAQVQAIIQLLRQAKPRDAEVKAKALVKQHPKLPICYHLLGSAQAAQKKTEEAENSLKTALSLDPNSGEIWDTYGTLLRNTGRVGQAIKAFGKAIKLLPGSASVNANLGLAFAQKGEAAAAIPFLQQALKSDTGKVNLHVTLGRQFSATKQYPEAVKSFVDAQSAGDKSAFTEVRLAEAYTKLGDHRNAMQHFEMAERAKPDFALTYAIRALYHQELGEFDTAEADFRKAIALEPKNGEHYRTFGTSYKLGLDKALMQAMQTHFADPDIDDLSRMHFGFALSRALEEQRAYDKVFTYLRPANDIMARRYPFDIKARQETVRGTMAAFKDVDIERRIDGTSDYAPIFVTGMPRSGTTLVEQILSSHSSVTGAGEVGYAVPLISKRMLHPDGKGHAAFDDMPDAVIAEFGHQIEAELRKRAPDTLRVTDKSIQTYMLMGAFKQCLPNAKIVLVRRDPRDLLFSIYKNFFREGTHTYAYDQKILGQYYRLFEQTVAFWREKMPGGFHEIQYEDLIENPEQETRSLLSACDLEWEDQCLSFHENKRQVSTLSVAQVRQPIYKSSMQSWQRYEDDLADLTAALRDAI